MPDPVYDPRDSNLRIGTNTSYTRQLVLDEPRRRTDERTNERYEMQPEILNDHSSLVQTSVVDKLQFISCSSNHGNLFR